MPIDMLPSFSADQSFLESSKRLDSVVMYYSFLSLLWFDYCGWRLWLESDLDMMKHVFTCRSHILIVIILFLVTQ